MNKRFGRISGANEEPYVRHLSGHAIHAMEDRGGGPTPCAAPTELEKFLGSLSKIGRTYGAATVARDVGCNQTWRRFTGRGTGRKGLWSAVVLYRLRPSTRHFRQSRRGAYLPRFFCPATALRHRLLMWLRVNRQTRIWNMINPAQGQHPTRLFGRRFNPFDGPVDKLWPSWHFLVGFWRLQSIAVLPTF